MENKEYEQGSKEWLELRKKHIGGSDIPIIVSRSPFKTVYVLWQEKTGKKEPDPPTPHMLRGVQKEEEARTAYIGYTGNLVIPRVMIYNEWEIAMASLDGCNEEGDIICEIKCPGEASFNRSVTHGVPDHYYAQIQWQLLVSGAKLAHYFCYMNPDRYHMLEVAPNKEYQEGLLLAAKEFWSCVENDVPPPITEKDYAMNEDKEANKLAEEWKDKKNQVKELTEEIKKIQAQLLEFTDDGNTIFNQANVKLKRITRKGMVDWKKVCEKYSIPEKELDKFRKTSVMFPSFSIINENKFEF